jgi:hypothetical protein
MIDPVKAKSQLTAQQFFNSRKLLTETQYRKSLLIPRVFEAIKDDELTHHQVYSGCGVSWMPYKFCMLRVSQKSEDVFLIKLRNRFDAPAVNYIKNQFSDRLIYEKSVRSTAELVELSEIEEIFTDKAALTVNERLFTLSRAKVVNNAAAEIVKERLQPITRLESLREQLAALRYLENDIQNSLSFFTEEQLKSGTNCKVYVTKITDSKALRPVSEILHLLNTQTPHANELFFKSTLSLSQTYYSLVEDEIEFDEEMQPAIEKRLIGVGSVREMTKIARRISANKAAEIEIERLFQKKLAK